MTGAVVQLVFGLLLMLGGTAAYVFLVKREPDHSLAGVPGLVIGGAGFAVFLAAGLPLAMETVGP
ncbi:hypothetical protein AAG589_21025 [Isoptericola sp. F-RaC21]|uniref:hypothetical protein n=1 Tax=Isoptericola sp. F-RaC21 TaxID=3141452 RepID=UPI00315BE416